MNGHKSDIRNGDKEKVDSESLNLSGHSVTDIKVAIVEKKNCKGRLERETSYINKFQLY